MSAKCGKRMKTIARQPFYWGNSGFLRAMSGICVMPKWQRGLTVIWQAKARKLNSTPKNLRRPMFLSVVKIKGRSNAPFLLLLNYV